MTNISIMLHFNDFQHANAVIPFYRAFCCFNDHFIYLTDYTPIRKAIPGGWEPETPVVHLQSRPNSRGNYVPRSGAI